MFYKDGRIFGEGEYSGNRERWQPPHFNSRRSKRDECVNQDTIVSKPRNLELVA